MPIYYEHFSRESRRIARSTAHVARAGMTWARLETPILQTLELTWPERGYRRRSCRAGICPRRRWRPPGTITSLQDTTPSTTLADVHLTAVPLLRDRSCCWRIENKNRYGLYVHPLRERERIETDGALARATGSLDPKRSKLMQVHMSSHCFPITSSISWLKLASTAWMDLTKRALHHKES